MYKKNLFYKIEIDGKTKSYEIKDLHINYNVSKSRMNNNCNCKIQIFNLGDIIRGELRYNKLEYKQGARFCKLYLGWNNQLSLVYNGDVYQCWSERNGNNIITNIECILGFNTIQTSTNNETIKINKPIEYLASTLKYMSGGIIEETQKQSLEKKQTFFGRTFDNISNILPKQTDFYFNDRKVFLLKDNTFFKTTIEVSKDTGLLTTPKDMGYYLELETILEPKINLSYVINLKSSVNKYLNGEYGVIELEHSGEISKNVGTNGKNITKLKVNKNNYINKIDEK